MPPDYFLEPEKTDSGLLEIKAFNDTATPAFDIADFTAYQRELLEKPYMLNVDYLIFAYTMSNEGVVSIAHIWLQKVWEICRPMRN